MGSGHILSYAFDLLMDMYKSSGYNERDAALLILKKNIYGVDIDDRAYQLAYFSLLMKGRKYNQKILQINIKMNLCSVKESNIISEKSFYAIINDNNHVKKDLEYLIHIFKDAKEYGSILNVNSLNFEELHDYLNNIKSKPLETLYDVFYTKNILNQLNSLIKQAKLLSKKYDVVFTNPPYLNGTRFSEKLSNYVKKNFPDTKTDLSTIIYQNAINSFCKKNGFISFITTTSWMFLSSFVKFREEVIKNIQIESLVDFGTELFEGKVGHNPIVAWINRNTLPSKNLTAIKLSEYNYSRRYEKELEYFNESNKFFINQENFLKIPGSPMAYWVSEKIIYAFETGEDITKYVDTFQGIITGDNNKFLRKWYEVSIDKITFNAKQMNDVNQKKAYWIPYNKGGKFRKWYGNQEYVINWENGPSDKTRGKKSFKDYYLREYVSWSYITSSTLSTRYFPHGFLWDVHGSGIFDKGDYLRYLQGLIGSKVSIDLLKIINPTMSFQVENITQIPVIIDYNIKSTIDTLVKENIKISKEDWDNYEISWNFKSHPLIPNFQSHELDSKQQSKIELTFNNWVLSKNNMVNKLKSNEEKINQLFIEIYGLENELISNMEKKEITLKKADLNNDIKSFIFYAIGCMFGRYSIDDEGLIFAGGSMGLI